MRHANIAATFGQRGPHLLVAERVAAGQTAVRENLGLRMLAIESALYWVVEDRGHQAKTGGAIIDGEKIDFWLRLADDDDSVSPEGRPLLTTPSWNGGRRRWTDKLRKPLEGQIGTIVGRFEAIAKGRIEERARREEADRKRELAQRKAARRFYKEKERKGREANLHALTKDWHEASRMTSFLDALEVRLADQPSDAAVTEWLEWARGYAAALSPLSPNRLAGLQRHAKAVAYEPVEDEDRHPYEDDWRCAGDLDRYLGEMEEAASG